MDSELLRRACERAGMRVDCTGPESSLRCWRATHGEWTWSLDDPALPSYVADLLVGMARELDRCIEIETRLLLTHPDQVIMDATPEQRITAAMAVLEAGDGR